MMWYVFWLLFNMIKSIFNNTKNIILKSYDKALDDNIFNLSAALAYYTVFSLAPLLYIIINSLGLIFDKNKISSAIFTVLSDLIGREGAIVLEDSLVNLVVNESSWFQNMLGILILVFTATTIFSTIQTGLNYIFRVKPKPKIGILKFIKTRLLSFSIIVGIAFVLIMSLMMDAFINLTSDYLVEVLPNIEFVIALLNNYFLPFFVSLMFFSLIFKFLPDAIISWKDVVIGSFFTSFLLTVGRYFIGLYLGGSDLGNLYNAAGSIMIIFVWLYYSSFIFYIGAIFTVIYAEEIGGGVIPEKNTLRFIHKEVKIADELEMVSVNKKNETVIDN